MRHAKLSHLKEIYGHFQSHREVFSHVRQDTLRCRIEAHQCIWQDGVIVVHQQYKKRTRIGYDQRSLGDCEHEARVPRSVEISTLLDSG